MLARVYGLGPADIGLLNRRQLGAFFRDLEVLEIQQQQRG